MHKGLRTTDPAYVKGYGVTDYADVTDELNQTNTKSRHTLKRDG